MPNKFLLTVDRHLKSLDKAQIVCKGLPAKPLGVITVFDICCTIVAFLGQNELRNIKFLKTVYYDTVVAYFPQLVNWLVVPAAKGIIILVGLLLIVIFLLRKVYRRPALLIAHSTMGHNLNEIDKNLTQNFRFKKIDIGQRLPSHNAQTQEIIEAIRTQDEAYRQIEKNNWRSIIFYYGVAHTPLAFHLGYQFGQTCKVHFLHRFRPTEDAQEFRELPISDEDKAALFHSDPFNEDYYNTDSQEMLVAIGTTYPIKKEDLRIIDVEQDMFIYSVQADKETLGYDFFSSYRKIHSYADRFVSDIRKICKERNIKKIHMVLSTSVPFTFYLAQEMNSNQFPEIIVYHYDHGCYTWGIDIQSESIVWLNSNC